jgi:tRNA 2-thiouridine synthesizing protein D
MFARAALRGGHSLSCVFFFDAGVLTAAAHCEAPQDETDVRRGWVDLHNEHDVPLVACVASAHRFGTAAVINAATDGESPFRIAGLGELIEASAESDRLLTFRA